MRKYEHLNKCLKQLQLELLAQHCGSLVALAELLTEAKSSYALWIDLGDMLKTLCHFIKVWTTSTDSTATQKPSSLHVKVNIIHMYTYADALWLPYTYTPMGVSSSQPCNG